MPQQVPGIRADCAPEWKRQTVEQDITMLCKGIWHTTLMQDSNLRRRKADKREEDEEAVQSRRTANLGKGES